MYSDTNKAWERVNETLPEEPLVVVLAPGNYLYHNGKPVNWALNLSGEVATVDGAACVVKIPTSYGQYAWHEDFGPEQYEEVREVLFEQEYKWVRKHKYDGTQWDQRTPEEKIADGDAPEVEPTPRELCDVRRAWDIQFLTGNGGEWRRGMLRCICQQSDCPNRLAPAFNEQRLLDAANSTHDLETAELMQSLVDSAKSGVK